MAKGVCAWRRGCVVKMACVAKGGDMYGKREAYMAKGGCAWDTTRYGDTINERAVRILLECILVNHIFKAMN